MIKQIKGIYTLLSLQVFYTFLKKFKTLVTFFLITVTIERLYCLSIC